MCAPRRVKYRADGARFRALGVDFETGLVGRHAVMNLLAAIAVARVFGIAAGAPARSGADASPSGKMRGERIEHNGIVIWNDCYNSNPEAAQSMIDVLRETPAPRRIAVLGEMLELGHAAEDSAPRGGTVRRGARNRSVDRRARRRARHGGRGRRRRATGERRVFF